MIPLMPGLFVTQELPGVGEWGQGRAARGLHVDPRVGRKPTRRGEQREALAEHGLIERRIEKHHIERLRRWPPQKLKGVGLHGFCAGGVQGLGVGTELLDDLPVLIHHHRRYCAAQERLEPKHATTREEDEAACAGNDIAQPVEQGLAHTVGRGPQTLERREGQLATPPLAADDAQPVAARAHGKAEAATAPPTITVTMRSGLMRRWKASRISFAPTASTLGMNVSR